MLEAGTNLPLEGATVWFGRILRRRGHLNTHRRKWWVHAKASSGQVPGAGALDYAPDVRAQVRGSGSTMFGWASPSNPSLAVDIQEPGQAEVTVPGRGIQTVILKLRRGSEIVGRILHGDRPVGGATVELVMHHRQSPSSARPALSRPVSGQAKSSSRRVVPLRGPCMPGTYLLRASSRSRGRTARFSTVYHPGSARRHRVPRRIDGRSGQAGHEVAVQPPAWCRPVRLSGRVSRYRGRRACARSSSDAWTRKPATLDPQCVGLPLKAGRDAGPRRPAASGVHALLYTRTGSATGRPAARRGMAE